MTPLPRVVCTPTMVDRHHQHVHPADLTHQSNSQSAAKLCYLSQFKEDMSEPCVSAQEINPVTDLLQTDD